MAEYLKTINGSLLPIGGTNVYVEQMSQAEYDALPSATQDDNHFRVITEADGEPGLQASEIATDDGNVQDDINYFKRHSTSASSLVSITESEYTATSDGYFQCNASGGAETVWSINNTIEIRLPLGTFRTCTFIRKGTTLKRTSGNGNGYFYPLT